MGGTTSGPRAAAKRLAVTGLVLLACALATYTFLRTTFGSRPARVNVRWDAAVGPSERAGLEQRFHLSDSQDLGERTFAYDVSDLSRANIEALVRNPTVEDTHFIDRAAYRVWYLAPRGSYPGAGRIWGTVLEVATALLALAACAALGLAMISAVITPALYRRLTAARETLSAPRRWAARRIPPASAEAVALFRMILGAALIAIVWSRPASAFNVDALGNLPPFHRALLAPFVLAPGAVAWLSAWMFVWGALFIVGAAATLAYSMVVLGFVGWAALITTNSGHHPISALVLALCGLLLSRWGDAWSVDAWRRGSRGLVSRVRAPAEYGFTVWLPGLVLGATFAAAAVAKLRESGIAWIANGTVKYHFLSDAAQAPLDWGLRIGLFPRLAVALSLAAVVIEALVIVGACSRVYVHRLAAGLAAVALLTGFGLFQGLFWPGWWVLALSFLPWHRVVPVATRIPHTETRTDARGWYGWAQGTFVIAVLVQQVVVSALQAEVSPFLSEYDMYATTYASPSEYEDKSATYFAVAHDGRECQLPDDDAETVAAADAEAGMILERCFGEGPSRDPVIVEKRQTSVDWEHWRPRGEIRTPLAKSGA